METMEVIMKKLFISLIFCLPHYVYSADHREDTVPLISTSQPRRLSATELIKAVMEHGTVKLGKITFYKSLTPLMSVEDLLKKPIMTPENLLPPHRTPVSRDRRDDSVILQVQNGPQDKQIITVQYYPEGSCCTHWWQQNNHVWIYRSSHTGSDEACLSCKSLHEIINT